MQKEGKIELYRFLACIFIMIGHFVFYTDPNLTIPFTVAYQFVEFFFIISGFFTARHFDVRRPVVKPNQQKGINRYFNNPISEILLYDIKKFARFLPYTIPAILMVYITESHSYLSVGDTAGFWHNLKDIFPEVFFLSVFRTSEAHLFIMWFLSAMFVVLPFLCLFFLIKYKPIKIVIGIIAPMVYYILAPDYAVQEPLNQLMRAFFGMLLGGSLYYISTYLADNKCVRPVKCVLTVVFFAGYIAPIVFSFLNYYLSYEYIICFVVWIFILMSDLTVLPPWHSKVMGFLGDISMPIFIWHIAIFKFISYCHILESHQVLRFVISVALVFTISLLNYLIVIRIKKYRQKP